MYMPMPRKQPIMVDGEECWRCAKCKEVKPAEDFYRLHRNPNGLTYRCQSCSKEHSKRWRDNNVQHHREKVRRWQRGNPEKVREMHRRWRSQNQEKLREISRLKRFRRKEQGMANSAVNHALRDRRLLKPDACERCGSKDFHFHRLEAHHHKGYAPEHRLDVIWLCSAPCHPIADEELRRANQEARVVDGFK